MPNQTPVGEHTSRLAQFVTGLQWQTIPAEVRHEALRSLVNYFAVALGACQDPSVDKAIRVMLPFRSTGGHAASLVGRPERFDMLHATALNAMAANVYDFDDTHIPTIVHPTAPVASALLALAQTRPLSGADFLLAFVAGVEVECRIANALSPGHYARGWHITSTCSIFGAAAAVAKVIGLSTHELVWALGNAAAQSAGLVETLGSSAKSISVGNAARNGLLSALLAQAGFEGPAAPLEGAFGFLKVVGDTVHWSALEGELPACWQLQRNTYKPYPCGVVLNPVIDACLELAARSEFIAHRSNTISRIEITGHPLLRQRTDRPGVTSGRQSQVSAQHAVGVALLRQRAGLSEFSDAVVADPAIRALGAKLVFIDNASLSVDAARVRVAFADGASIESRIDAARGSLGNPLTDAELEAKLHTLCAYGKAGVDASRLIAAVWALEHSRDAGEIMALAAPPAQQ